MMSLISLMVRLTSLARVDLSRYLCQPSPVGVDTREPSKRFYLPLRPPGPEGMPSGERPPVEFEVQL